ncbi:hypothetical protein MKW92_032228, partial [Papaver armeniacum]
MLKGTQVFVDFLLAKDLRPSFVTSRFARSVSLVDAFTANACGSFLSFIPVFVTNL